MSRYSPTYYGDTRPRDYGSEIADAIGGYIGLKRQEKLDTEREQELAYQRQRRERLDPLEEAFLRAHMYEQGVVPSAGGGGGDVPRAPGNRTQGDAGSLLSAAIGEQRGNRTQANIGAQSATGMNAPGAFNPVTGTFNPAGQGRVALGGGYELDPSLTERGRTEARERENIAAYMAATGRDRGHATLDVRGIQSEELHPGPYHPRTVAEALDYEKQLIHARGVEQQRVAEIREETERRRNPPKDLRWEERRNGWAKELGQPTNQLQQDLLDALADGDEPSEILQAVPRSQRPEAERYLRRATRLRRRATGVTPGEESPPEPE